MTEIDQEELRKKAYAVSDDIMRHLVDNKIPALIAHMAILDCVYALSYMAKIPPTSLETIFLDMLAQYNEEHQRQIEGFKKLED